MHAARLDSSGLVIVAMHNYVRIAGFGPTFRPFAPAQMGARSDKFQRSTIRLTSAKAWGESPFQNERVLMQLGTVKFYNDQKGFGFIAPDNGGPDVFVHATALERAGMHNLSEGQKVSFDTEKDSRSGKMAVGTIAAA
jgi:CspA family cold shock protein